MSVFFAFEKISVKVMVGLVAFVWSFAVVVLLVVYVKFIRGNSSYGNSGFSYPKNVEKRRTNSMDSKEMLMPASSGGSTEEHSGGKLMPAPSEQQYRDVDQMRFQENIRLKKQKYAKCMNEN
uniref:Uncharacterized protein n=1 Tax=Ditylenchus dipsaci TaxID=166011 RepID=A0A915DBS2_9BILA